MLIVHQHRAVKASLDRKMSEHTLIVYHGTAVPPFEDLAYRQTWFAEKLSDADEYRLASLLKEADGVELPEGTYDINELGTIGIKSVLAEEGIDQSGGRIVMASLFPKKIFEISEITGGEVNVSSIKNAWGKIHLLGAIDEPWETLDEDYQCEISERFSGKAWWSLLEELDVYSWLKTEGYDSVKILDVNMSGREHMAYLALNSDIVIILDQNYKAAEKKSTIRP
jgi:hypothetical protein